MRMMLPALLITFAAACAERPVPVAPAEPAPRRPEPAPELVRPAEAAPIDAYAYTPVGKRDPFRNPSTPSGPPGDCALQAFDLDQLKLVAVALATTPYAMVE